jgi:hypothetical protein
VIGTEVRHPQFGPGQIVELFRDGNEWMVRFENGLRFRRSRSEFEGESADFNQQQPYKQMNSALSIDAPAPMSTEQYAARKLIESLRMGIAPANYVSELTIGLEREKESLVKGLNNSQQNGGAVRAIVGEYGFGKSHIVELTTQEALAQNFLVGTVSLDLLELPPHRSFDIYSGAMRNLKYPDSDEKGLRRLLEKSADQRTLAQLRDLSPAEIDPLVIGLAAIADTASSRQRKAWINWLMGGRRMQSMNKGVPKGIKFPSIYKIGHNARQIAYLFTAISVLARLAGYSGLCVLIDEAESYSLLRPYQRPKASLFFQSMIYAALREQQAMFQESQFPQNRFRSYPLAYDQEQSLFFLFTVTHSDHRMPLESWLQPDQIILLKPNVSPKEVGEFLQKVLVYHQGAYRYELDERQGQIRRAAAEHLAQGLRNNRLSLRGMVRSAINLFDLLYLYPELDAAVLLEELRQNMA